MITLTALTLASLTQARSGLHIDIRPYLPSQLSDCSPRHVGGGARP